MRAIQWIPTWQGLSVFQKSLRFCALDESSHSIETGLTLPMARLLSSVTYNSINSLCFPPKHKGSTIFENDLNPVMLVFIAEYSQMSTHLTGFQ